VSSFGVIDDRVRFTKGVWVIFVSTTGQGAMPFSMRGLWKEMMRKGFSVGEGAKFAVYSLGDRGYGENFGVAGRKLRQRLRMLGA
jgi:sulfite reductase alpha subunit-like flavoprotein